MSQGTNFVQVSPAEDREKISPPSSQQADGAVNEQHTNPVGLPNFELKIVACAMSYLERSSPGSSARVSLLDGIALIQGTLLAIRDLTQVAVGASGTTGFQSLEFNLISKAPFQMVHGCPPSSFIEATSKSVADAATAVSAAAKVLEGGLLKKPSSPTKERSVPNNLKKGSRVKTPSKKPVGTLKVPNTQVRVGVQSEERLRLKLQGKALRSLRSAAWQPIAKRFGLTEEKVKTAVAAVPADQLHVDKHLPPLERIPGLLNWDSIRSWADRAELEIESTQLVKAALSRFEAKGPKEKPKVFPVNIITGEPLLYHMQYKDFCTPHDSPRSWADVVKGCRALCRLHNNYVRPAKNPDEGPLVDLKLDQKDRYIRSIFSSDINGEIKKVVTFIRPTDRSLISAPSELALPPIMGENWTEVFRKGPLKSKASKRAEVSTGKTTTVVLQEGSSRGAA